MSKDRLNPDTLMLINGPRLILGGSIESNPNESSDRLNRVNPRTFRTLAAEYRSIHKLITSLIPPEQLIIVDTLYGEPDCNDKFEKMIPKDLKDLPFTALPHGSNRAHFVRDAHTFVNGLFIPNNETWGNYQLPYESALGEGGAVLSRKDVIIPTYKILIEVEEGRAAEQIEELGFRFGVLSPRDPEATEVFAETHIDAHTSLVEDTSGNLHLLATKKYHAQDDLTQFAIAQTVELNDISLHLVDDTDFPPMALNLIQLDDGSIVMTSGAPELEATLKLLVGEKKVLTTDRQIRVIPEKLHAGIRCITNTAPRSLLTITPHTANAMAHT